MEHARKSAWPTWLAMGIFLVAIYGGAYAALIDYEPYERTIIGLGPHGPTGYCTINHGYPQVPVYWKFYKRPSAWQRSLLTVLFSPAHQIDRRLRPAYWNGPKT